MRSISIWALDIRSTRIGTLLAWSRSIGLCFSLTGYGINVIMTYHGKDGANGTRQDGRS